MRSFLPLRPLRIAQIPPLYESVSPKLYGGTERIVAYFWPKRLVRRGHDVTLYAAGDSTANVRLAAGSCQSLRLIGLADFGPMFHLPMLSDVYDHAGEFDVIHSHVDCLSFPLTRMVHVPTVSTMLGQLDLSDCCRSTGATAICRLCRLATISVVRFLR